MPPIYDFYCEKCDYKFEAYKPYVNRDKEPCPECGLDCDRASHFEDQKLKKCGYTPPPKATRKFGEKYPTPHRRKRW